MISTEKRFEEDIETFLVSTEGGYTKTTDTYDPVRGLYVDTLIRFVQATQPKEWARFERQCNSDPVKKFCLAFDNAVDDNGLIPLLRHAFEYRGIIVGVFDFDPESRLNKIANDLYEQNIVNCVRQWHYTNKSKNSVDMVLVINGIPVIALELKNQYTGQTVKNAKELC